MPAGLAPERRLFAEFDDAIVARHAYADLERRGYMRLEIFSPFPIEKEVVRSRGASQLGMLAFAAGAVGGLAGYGVQWFANVHSYALNIGGRPAHAAPAFAYATLESVMLFAGLATFAGVLVALRLPRLWQPEFEIDGFDRASIDRHWITVGVSSESDLARALRDLGRVGAGRIVQAQPDA